MRKSVFGTTLFILAGSLILNLPSADAQTTNAGPRTNNDALRGSFSFRLTSVKSFSADDPADTGGRGGAPRQDILRVGSFVADGRGNLKGVAIATTDTNNGTTWTVKFNWTGKYVVYPDGTGYASTDAERTSLVCTNTTVPHTGPKPHPVAPGGTPLQGNAVCAGTEEGHEDYALVVSPGGNIELIQTDNEGGGAKIFLTGTARRW